MNVETIINNDEYKIIFLKAILLGINYGKNENSDFYLDNIQNEINKINNKLNHPEVVKYKQLMKRNEINIINLEYQKNMVVSNIQKLSYNNYSSNHSKINILKNQLNNINLEIEKCKINFKKFKELKDKAYNISDNSNANFNNTNNMNLNNININNIQHINNTNTNRNKEINKNNRHNNSNIEILNENQKNNNLVGELEKTLDNLSNLFS